jgi:hypothetical protein
MSAIHSFDFSTLSYDDAVALLSKAATALYGEDGYWSADQVVDVAAVLGVTMNPEADTAGLGSHLNLILNVENDTRGYLNRLACVITGEE